MKMEMETMTRRLMKKWPDEAVGTDLQHILWNASRWNLAVTTLPRCMFLEVVESAFFFLSFFFFFFFSFARIANTAVAG